MNSTNMQAGPILLTEGEAGPGEKPARIRAIQPMRRGGLWLASLLAVGYLMLTLAVPLFFTVRGSVDYDPFWGAYTNQLTSSSNLIILGRTLLLAAFTTAITTLVGYPVAYAMTLMSPRTRAVFLALLVFPQLTSFLVRSYAWIGLLGVNGPIVEIARWFGGSATTYNYTDVGVSVVLLHVFLPIMILTCYVSMARINPMHLRAARTLGANHFESFWRVYAPQTKAGVVSGAVLVFIGAAGMYVTPALIGGPTFTTLVTVVVDQVTHGIFGVDPAYPAALTVILAAVVALALTMTARSVRLGEVLGLRARSERKSITPRQSARGQRWQPLGPIWAVARRIPAGSERQHILVRTVLVVAVLLIDIPFVYLIGMSFQPLPLLAFPTGEWSTRWYSRVLNDPTWGAAVLQSAQIAVLATLIALVVGSFLALRTTKVRPFTGKTIISAALLPLIVPAVMYATGIYTVFAELGLVGNWVAIAFVHSVLALPYVYVNVLNGLHSYDLRWDQAASSLGASPGRRLRKVTLPLLRPSLITGAFLAALVSVDEFTVTLFIGGPSFQSLPLKYWSSAQENLSPELAVVGVLLTGAILAIAALNAVVLHATRLTTKTHRNAS